MMMMMTPFVQIKFTNCQTIIQIKIEINECNLNKRVKKCLNFIIKT